MSPLDSFWTGVLSVLTPLVTPDWGKLVGVIPLLLLLVVLLFLAMVARAWVRLLGSQPARGPKGRQRSLRPMLLGHLAVIGVGIVTVALAFVAGSGDPSWTGGNSPFGLVVNAPLLILGLALVVGSAGNAARLWERNGRDDITPDALDAASAAIRRHPARAKRIVVFVAGVMIAATGLSLGHAPGYTGGGPLDVAVIPLLILGLVLAVGSVGAAIASLWTQDPDFDPPKGDESSALVPVEH
jgi:hypothetical protein